MWSSLTISSPSDQSVAGTVKPVAQSNDDPFFNELMKAKPSPTKTTTKETSIKETTASVNEESDDWDVDGWEVSNVQTPQPKPISRQTSIETPQLKQMTNTIMEELREYLLNFADPRATSELNEDLNEKSFGSLLAYYKTRPELAAYTIEHEVSRMQYEVTTELSEVVKCGKGDIDGIEAVSSALRYAIEKGEGDPTHVLIRMANQSLLADFLSALQDYLLKPELHTSVVVGDVNFTVDLENMLLVCEAVFEISTIDSKQHRILLGTLPASVTVAAGLATQDLVFEFKRPELRVVLDDELRGAASAIARQRLEELEMEQNFSGQGGEEPATEESVSHVNSDNSGGGLLSFFNTTSPVSEPPSSPRETESAPFMRLYNIDTPTKNKP